MHRRVDVRQDLLRQRLCRLRQRALELLGEGREPQEHAQREARRERKVAHEREPRVPDRSNMYNCIEG